MPEGYFATRTAERLVARFTPGQGLDQAIRTGLFRNIETGLQAPVQRALRAHMRMRLKG